MLVKTIVPAFAWPPHALFLNDPQSFSCTSRGPKSDSAEMATNSPGIVPLVPGLLLFHQSILEHPWGDWIQKCDDRCLPGVSRCQSLLFVIFISLGTRRAKCKKPMPAKLSYEFASKVQAATCIFACICVLLHYLFLFVQKCARRPRREAYF